VGRQFVRVDIETFEGSSFREQKYRQRFLRQSSNCYASKWAGVGDPWFNSVEFVLPIGKMGCWHRIGRQANEMRDKRSVRAKSASHTRTVGDLARLRDYRL
jgi:hypothetical protein